MPFCRECGSCAVPSSSGLRGGDLLRSSGFIDERTERFVEIRRGLAIGNKRPGFIYRCDHRRRVRDTVEHRLVERLLDLFDRGGMRRAALLVVIYDDLYLVL